MGILRVLDLGDWNVRLDKKEYVNIKIFFCGLGFNVLVKIFGIILIYYWESFLEFGKIMFYSKRGGGVGIVLEKLKCRYVRMGLFED